MSKDEALSLYNQANDLYHKGQKHQAVDLYKKALSSDITIPEIHHNLAITYADLQEFDRALKSYKKALKLEPGLHLAQYNLANLYLHLGDYHKAQRRYEIAIQLEPNFTQAHINLGIAHHHQNQFQLSNQAFIASLRIEKTVPGYVNCATNLMRQNAYDEAYELLLEAYQHFPDDPLVLLNLSRIARINCDFKKLEEVNQKMTSDPNFHQLIRDHKDNDPFFSLMQTTDLEENLHSAKRAATIYVQTPTSSVRIPPRPSTKKIHVAYMSFDFRDHVICHHSMGLFKHHDRKKFKVSAFSINKPDDGYFYRYIQDHADHFENIHDQNHHTAAQTIANRHVDILVDLTGHTAGNKMIIFRHKPAPIQVNYLGFPGSLGADYIPYLISDPVLTPPEHKPFYSEKLVYLDGVYQISSYQEMPQIATPTKKLDHGLPEKYFVFASFNNTYKFDHDIVDTWMEILKNTQKTLLWLLNISDAAAKNIHQFAKDKGVNHRRIIFAKRTSMEKHLDRLRHIDIALDTPRYNGGATTSNALYAGIPVIGTIGSNYPSRMTTSLLTHAGLTELITPDLKSYKSLAIALATNPQKLQKLREKTSKLNKGSLFNTAHITKNIEKAYTIMWQRHLDGLPPDHIDTRVI